VRFFVQFFPSEQAYYLEDFSCVMPANSSFTGFAWKNPWRRASAHAADAGRHRYGHRRLVALVGYARAFEHEWLRMYEGRAQTWLVEKSFLNTSLDEAVARSSRRCPGRTGPADDLQPDGSPRRRSNALVFGCNADSYELDSLNLTSGSVFRMENLKLCWRHSGRKL